MEEQEPRVTWDSERESYMIAIGSMRIFLAYGETKTFNWFTKDENEIHTLKIKTVEGDE